MSALDPEVNGDSLPLFAAVIGIFVQTVVAVAVGCLVLFCVGFLLRVCFGVKF